MLPTALTIAGSDPSGGAGIQADLKTFHQFAVYGQAAIALLTVQNTQGVRYVELVRPEVLRDQITAVLSDIPPLAAKTGALGGVEQIETVAALAASFTFPLVIDPVMVSKHGAPLLAPDGEAVLKKQLLPHCALVTPNVAEAERLSGLNIHTAEDMGYAARRIAASGARSVLVKGGHLNGEPVDVLLYEDHLEFLPGRRIPTRHTHGTGCTYSAAITALLARGLALPAAVAGAKKFIQKAIETAPGLGHGAGPVNHLAPVPEAISAASS
jgi:hydroxymethylpyrimidine/phosphomethylpyrimidine kinase